MTVFIKRMEWGFFVGPMKSLINQSHLLTGSSRMCQLVSMMSSFVGEKWDFQRVFEHSRLSEADLNASREYLIDVREESELSQSGRIPNAINIPLGGLEATLKSAQMFAGRAGPGRRVPSNKTDNLLVFTCQSGMRAVRAAGMAKQLGFEKVAVYPGSFSEWSRQINK